jgi:hypothetical protein
MALLISAQVIRDLIIDGSYAIECIEQRDQGRVAVMLALKSRTQPITVQIETTDHKLAGLFHALLQDNTTQKGRRPGVRVGSQAVPVIDVDTMPADQPQAHQRKPRQRRAVELTGAETPPKRGERRRAALRQLILMPQDVSSRASPSPEAPKTRPRSRVSNGKADG